MALTLTDDDLDAIAHRVLELRAEATPPAWLTSADVMAMLAVSRDWVQNHAGDLGGVKIAGVLRFERSKLRDVLEQHRLNPRRTPTPRRRPGPARQPRGGLGFPLIPIPKES